MGNEDRAKDWLAQAKNDLEWGASSLRSKFYSQTCFIAQQASEKALKALAYKRGYDLVKGHSVRAVAVQLGFNNEIEDAAKVLDQYYIGSRYPDSLPEGAPFEFFSEKQGQEALELARKIVTRVENEFGIK